MNSSSRKQLDEYKLRQNAMLKEQDMLNKRLLEEASRQKVIELHF